MGIIRQTAPEINPKRSMILQRGAWNAPGERLGIQNTHDKLDKQLKKKKKITEMKFNKENRKVIHLG